MIPKPHTCWFKPSVTASTPISTLSSTPTAAAASSPAYSDPVSLRDDEAAERREQHRAFDAQVQHARALDDRLAERPEQDRRRNSQSCAQQAKMNSIRCSFLQAVWSSSSAASMTSSSAA
ncbi:MAG: hypothetical protein U0521_24200 [Anaerolineae bacterium]